MESPSAVLRRLLDDDGPNIPSPFGRGVFDPAHFNGLPFDQRVAVPNPADRIRPIDAGDEGQGDEKMQKLRDTENVAKATNR